MPDMIYGERARIVLAKLDAIDKKRITDLNTVFNAAFTTVPKGVLPSL